MTGTPSASTWSRSDSTWAGGNGKGRPEQYFAVLAQDPSVVAHLDHPGRDQPKDFSRRTEGGKQRGYEDIGIEHDPHRARRARAAPISVLMSSSDIRSVPALRETCCMAVAAA